MNSTPRRKFTFVGLFQRRSCALLICFHTKFTPMFKKRIVRKQKKRRFAVVVIDSANALGYT